MGVKVKEKIAGSGVFWLFINHKGKRKSKCVGSERAALEVKSIIEAKLKLGQPVPKEEQPSPKMSTYYEKYRQCYFETALRHSTRIRHEGNFNNHILPAIGHLRLDEVTREKMQELIATLIKKELSKDSIRLALAAICGLYTFAIENKVAKENPAVKLGKYYAKVRKVRDEIDPLTADEVSLFLRTVQRSKYYREYYPVFLCAIHAGLRAGELAGLQWRDLGQQSAKQSTAQMLRRIGSAQEFGKARSQSGSLSGALIWVGQSVTARLDPREPQAGRERERIARLALPGRTAPNSCAEPKKLS